MAFEGSVYVRHHLFGDALLYVDGFEETGEPRREDGVHLVSVVEADESGVDVCGVKVTKERRGNRAHALDISALLTM